MKVVALVSGGKDSCYAMMKCIQYGHEVSLLPRILSNFRSFVSCSEFPWNCLSKVQFFKLYELKSHLGFLDLCLHRSWHWLICCRLMIPSMNWTAICIKL